MTVVSLHEGGKDRNATPGQGVIASLDIGSSKICCMIAEVVAGNRRSTDLRAKLRILGVGYTASRGVHAGAIASVVEAEKAIRLAVDAAEKQANRSIFDVHVGVTGGYPQSLCRSGTATVIGSVVSNRDIDAAVAAALEKTEIGSRAILHLAPVSYGLDGVHSVSPPLGMHGKQLSVELGVVTVESSFLRNITMAVERAHLNPCGFVMAPYASAHCALVNDEMKLGTVLVELGSALTSVGYFNGGHLVAADSIHLGGERITNDIALGLNTNLVHAERLKTLHGSVVQSVHDDDEMLAVPMLGEGEVQYVSKSILTAIIRPRAEEIIEHVRNLLMTEPFALGRTVRVVFAGGGANLPGLRELASGILGRHVRMASIPDFEGLPDLARQSAFSVPTGLVCYGLSPDKQYALPRQAVAAIERQQMGYVRRVGRWLADSF